MSETDAARRVEELEAEVAELRRQLTDSQRLATIGTMSAAIAHEFNNLLTPVVSYAQYALSGLRAGKSDPALVEKALAKAAAGGERAGRICASMLGLARGELASDGEIELGRLVEEAVIVLARDPAKDGITLRIQVPAGLQVHGDAVQLEQVILNLLINARQALLGREGRGSGSITVRGGLDVQTGEVVLSVADTGPGIPQDILPRIFEPFFTTKSAAGADGQRGSGLGLAICRQIIEAHRGQISVVSEAARGATFTLRLPAPDVGRSSMAA